MKPQRIAIAILLVAFVVMLVPIPATAQPSTIEWTVEAVDTAQSAAMVLSLSTGTDYTQTYPAVAVKDATSTFPVFYTKETGTWVKYTIAAVASTNNPIVRQDTTDPDHWQAAFYDGTDIQVYDSTNGGQTWVLQDTVALAGACGPVRGKFAVFGAAIGGQGCDGGAGQLRGLRSTDSGVSWDAPLLTNCKMGTSETLTFFGGTSWATVAVNTGTSDFSIETSNNDCSTTTLTALDPDAALNTGQLSPTGKGVVWICNAASGATREICWNPADSTPSDAETEVLVAASLTVDTAAEVINAESGSAAVFITSAASATVGELDMVLTVNGGTDWVAHQVPVAVDPEQTELTASIIDGQVYIFYQDETTDDLFVAYTTNLDLTGTIPTSPSGLSGVNHKDTDKVNLRWVISTTDPDQDVGEYTYEIFVNGVNIGDDTDGGDGGGFREVILTLGGESSVVIQVRALDPITNLVSPLSCAISINLGRDLASDSCGTGVGLGGGGSPADDFLGINLQDTADQAGMDVEGLRWFLGVLMILALAAPLLIAFGTVGGVLGGLTGLALAIGFGLIPLWFVVLIALLAAAAIAFMRR